MPIGSERSRVVVSIQSPAATIQWPQSRSFLIRSFILIMIIRLDKFHKTSGLLKHKSQIRSPKIENTQSEKFNLDNCLTLLNWLIIFSKNHTLRFIKKI